ncbi:MAG: helix-turn-helix domain-containing protein [Rudaea sp.]
MERHRLSSWPLQHPWAAVPNSLAKALKKARHARGLSQEAFSDVSSRTYMSTLERGIKNPTVAKLTQLCKVMDIHPLTLLTLAFAGERMAEVDSLFARVRREIKSLAMASRKR